MIVYVLGGKWSKQFIKLCESLEVCPGMTKEKLLEAGFTNYHKPSFCWLKRINHKTKRETKLFPVTLNVVISAETLQLKEFCLLDECFGQPSACNEFQFLQIEQYINELKNKNILRIK